MSTTTSALLIHTDLEIVRAALDLAERTSISEAHRVHNVSRKAIARWRARRAATPGWPTDQDIAEWKADDAANRDRRRAVADRELAYRKRRYLAGGAPLLISSRGTSRRLQALFALGWTLPQLGRRVGRSGAWMGNLMVARRDYVTQRTATDIAKLYDELCMTVPPTPTNLPPHHFDVHARARRIARRRGYVPPLGWDDIDNDEHPAVRVLRVVSGRPATDVDPSVVERLVAGERMPGSASTKAEKCIAMARLIADGRSEKFVTTIHGWKAGRYNTPAAQAIARAYLDADLEETG